MFRLLKLVCRRGQVGDGGGADAFGAEAIATAAGALAWRVGLCGRRPRTHVRAFESGARAVPLLCWGFLGKKGKECFGAYLFFRRRAWLRYARAVGAARRAALARGLRTSTSRRVPPPLGERRASVDGSLDRSPLESGRGEVVATSRGGPGSLAYSCCGLARPHNTPFSVRIGQSAAARVARGEKKKEKPKRSEQKPFAERPANVRRVSPLNDPFAICISFISSELKSFQVYFRTLEGSKDSARSFGFLQNT